MVNSGARLLSALLLSTFPALGAAQDAPALLEEVRKGMGGNPPQVLRITAAGSGYRAAAGEPASRTHFRIDPHTQDLDPGADPAVLWTTPHGFLAGAAARPVTISTETLFGTPYRVVTFTTANGRLVRGYVTGSNVLERTRTELDDPARGKVQVETVYLSWVDFSGLKYPSVIVHKENDEVSRILIVEKVEAAGAV